MSTWWVHQLWEQGARVELFSRIFWVIFSIVLHELAHGWAALWQGDDTPRRLDRMTLNPLVHMGPWSLLMFAVCGIAWGVMPTDPSQYRWGRRGHVIVAGAGPAMNVLLALVTLTAAGLVMRFSGSSVAGMSETTFNVFIFLFTGGWLNLVLATFNMLPVPPLDGASVLGGFSRRAYELYQQPNATFIGFGILMVVFATGLASPLFGAMSGLAMLYVVLVGV